jgi:hypothetical protein
MSRPLERILKAQRREISPADRLGEEVKKV